MFFLLDITSRLNTHYHTMNTIYEPRPKHIDPNAWVAPEHRRIAVSMNRTRKGELIIELPDILREVKQKPVLVTSRETF